LTVAAANAWFNDRPGRRNGAQPNQETAVDEAHAPANNDPRHMLFVPKLESAKQKTFVN